MGSGERLFLVEEFKHFHQPPVKHVQRAAHLKTNQPSTLAPGNNQYL